MKSGSMSFVIRETQIKITRYYFAPIRMAIILKKKKKITNVGKDVEKLEQQKHCW